VTNAHTVLHVSDQVTVKITCSRDCELLFITNFALINICYCFI